MNCAFATLLTTAAFVAMLVATVRAQRRCTAWNTVYGTVAKRYNGILSHATWFNRPVIRVQYGRTVAVVTTLKTRHGEVTQVCIEWPFRQFRLEIATEDLLSMVRQRRTCRIDAPAEGGELFHFFSNQEQAANRVLSPGVLWQLDRLRASFPPPSLFVDISRGSMSIRKLGFVRRVDHLDMLVRGALELFDQAMLTQTEGIEFVNSNEAQLLEEPVCQVCGETISGEIVFCSRCRTAHCEECWEYTGVCSTFACGETRYVRPVVAAPLSSSPTQPTNSLASKHSANSDAP